MDWIVPNSSNAVTEFLIFCDVLKVFGKYIFTLTISCETKFLARFNPRVNVCDTPKNVPCINNRHIFLTKKKKPDSSTPPVIDTSLSKTTSVSSQNSTMKNDASSSTTFVENSVSSQEPTLVRDNSSSVTPVNSQFSSQEPTLVSSDDSSSTFGSGSCRSNGQLIIDGLDCTKFFKCIRGVPSSQECPFGLRYLILILLYKRFDLLI